jgi:hypothetical protein
VGPHALSMYRPVRGLCYSVQDTRSTCHPEIGKKGGHEDNPRDTGARLILAPVETQQNAGLQVLVETVIPSVIVHYMVRSRHADSTDCEHRVVHSLAFPLGMFTAAHDVLLR